jgi:hypothetical protein
VNPVYPDTFHQSGRGGPPFELILLTIERDLPVLSVGMPYIRRFLAPAKVTFLASDACLHAISEMGIREPRDVLLDEDQAVPGLTLDTVRSLLAARGADPRRAGWYFKQFLNLAYAARPGVFPYYLTWDADTIPVRPICFFDGQGRTLLAPKSEYHRPYFDTIHKLLGLDRMAPYSFISEHMIFERRIVLSLLEELAGMAAFGAAEMARRIINAVSPADLSASGFAEYETYGTFASARSPDSIASRHLPSTRHGTDYFGRSPSADQLFAVSLWYSWASFESWPTATLQRRLKRVMARIIGRLWLGFALLLGGKARAEFASIPTQAAPRRSDR